MSFSNTNMYKMKYLKYKAKYQQLRGSGDGGSGDGGSATPAIIRLDQPPDIITTSNNSGSGPDGPGAGGAVAIRNSDSRTRITIIISTVDRIYGELELLQQQLQHIKDSTNNENENETYLSNTIQNILSQIKELRSKIRSETKNENQNKKDSFRKYYKY